ncbi:MAG: hypothetical protein ACYTJ0_18910, partial [Planctomycetota bacterium]
MNRGAGSTIDRRGRLPRRFVHFAVGRPRLTLLAWALMTALATPGVLIVEIETSTDSVLDQRSEAWAFYQESQHRFGGDEILTVLIEG